MNDLIAHKQTRLSDKTHKQAILIWIISLGLSIIPAILLSVHHIGLLQILGVSNTDTMLIDMLSNTLFIGSGTKPIHDIMKRISTKPNLETK